MAVATYHRDADGLDLVRLNILRASDVEAAVRAVLAVRTSIGHPTLDVEREDGSSLSLSTDGRRAFLVRIDADGTSWSSVGGDPDGPLLVFDCRGSWSEAASANTVALGVAIDALSHFAASGSVTPALIHFQPD